MLVEVCTTLTVHLHKEILWFKEL